MRTLAVVALLFVASAARALSFSTTGPFGPELYPKVSKIAVTPGEPGLLYAVSGGSLYRSRDFGDTWLTLPPAPTPLQFVAFDPRTAETIYTAGVFDHPWRSNDGGMTWRALTTGVPAGGFNTIALLIDPHIPSTLYIGGTCAVQGTAGGGIYRSTDLGERWAPYGAYGDCLRYLWLDPAKPYNLWYGIWFSEYSVYTADGSSWFGRNPPDPPMHVVATDPHDPLKSYELMSMPNSLPMLRVSTDGEATWQTVAAVGLPPQASDFVIDPASGHLLLAGSDGFFMSKDSGSSWLAVAGTLGTGLAINGDFLYVYGGVCSRLPLATLSDPVTMKIGIPAPRTDVSGIVLDPHDAATLFVTGSDGAGNLLLWRSHDSGSRWESVTLVGGPTGLSSPMAIDAAGDLYTAYQGIVWRFEKATQTWDSWAVQGLEGYVSLMANPQRPGWLYAIDRRLLSIDGGRTWQPMQDLEPAASLFSFAPNGRDASAHVETRNWESHDGGLTWSSVPDGTDFSFTREVAVAASRPSTIYRTVDEPQLSIDDALFRSDDGGTTWVALHRPGEQLGGGKLVVDPRDDRSVWIGLQHSADGGMTWTDESGNLQAGKAAADVAIDASGSVLYVLPMDRGSVWRAPLHRNRIRAVPHP